MDNQMREIDTRFHGGAKRGWGGYKRSKERKPMNSIFEDLVSYYNHKAWGRGSKEYGIALLRQILPYETRSENKPSIPNRTSLNK